MTATPSQLKIIWPTFAAVPDETIQYWLDIAAPAVTWDDDHAHMLLAAHYLTINGNGAGATAQLAAGGAAGVKMIRTGSLTIDFGDSATWQGLASTTFGLQFLDIAISYRGGPFVTSTGTLPDCQPYGAPWAC